MSNEIAKNEIINVLATFYESGLKQKTHEVIQEKLAEKFSGIVSNLLECKYGEDNEKLKIYFKAIFYDKVVLNEGNDINLLFEYFMSLFDYIHKYTEKEEENLKNKLTTKYKIQFSILRNLILNYKNTTAETTINNNNNNSSNKNSDFISLLDLKTILNSNELKLKEKYIEYIIFYMKRFKNENVSLYDLKISNIDELLNKNINNENDENNKINKLVEEKELKKQKEEKEEKEVTEEITRDNFNKTIHDILIKNLLKKENKNFKEEFQNCLEKNSNNLDVISIHSLNKFLIDKEICLNNLQLSCLSNRYCVDDDLIIINASMLEEDLKNLKDDVINDYVNFSV